MEGGGEKKAAKFTVYKNPALSAALTASTLRPSKSSLLLLLSLSSSSALSLLSLFSREKTLIEAMMFRNLPRDAAYVLAKAIQALVGLFLTGSVFALFKALQLHRARDPTGKLKESGNQSSLTRRQLELIGLKPKVEPAQTDSSKKPPKSKATASFSDILVPIHQQITSSNIKSRSGSDKSKFGSGSSRASFSMPPKSQSSPSSLYLVSGAGSLLSPTQASPGVDSAVSSPWSGKQAISSRDIKTEEQLEEFLKDVSEKITESAGKLATPPPTIKSFDMASPQSVPGPASTSGTARSTPLRPVRMSPGSQKFTTPPKKGEGEPPPPMSVEESIEAFNCLGIYPQIELWRDHLRQWFSSVLLNPLLNKIETSHIQVMQTAAKLGMSITISQVGSDPLTSGDLATVSSIEKKDWPPAFTLDEDGVLNQLRISLMKALDLPQPKSSLFNTPPASQQNPSLPAIKECLDAIIDHQTLHALMKGEWAKGFLSHVSIREDYMVQRIRELAKGSCVKNYEYVGNGEVYDQRSKKWTVELPTDSQILLYLFCAFLEHPKWMLHLDPVSYTGAQSSKNPLFLGVLPPKERFPEKYIVVISGDAPTAPHPGACVFVVGKQRSPIYALYWDKKLQFSLQGRTALWNSILLLCHRIKVGYGGVVRGVHLGSSALCLLPVIDSESN